MIASTGKPPETLLQSTLTTLGDYDTCLGIDITENLDNSNRHITGKYCLIDVFPMKYRNISSQNIFSLDQVTIFKYFPFKHGICLPSNCTNEEARHLLRESLLEYPLIVKGDLTCDTLESVSWISRFKNLNIHQIISLIFISTVLIVTSVATYYHVIAKYILKDDSFEKNDLLMALSCWENMKKLFIRTPDKNSRFVVIDFIKLFSVISGTVAHFMVNIEIPNGYLMVDRHINMNVIFSKTLAQLFMNENTLTIFAFLG